MDNKNDKELVSKEKADKYLPVDMYIGGVEHAVLHLLYSRFYTKFLHDIGVVDFDEPFKKLFNQGMIGKNGAKMSKSKGNVVSPDDLVRDYGCDSLRMYELFVGPPELDAEWDDRGIDGVHRFLSRFWTLVEDNADKNFNETDEMVKLRHKMVYDITNRLENFSLNTVVSGFMEYTNKLVDLTKKQGGIVRPDFTVRRSIRGLAEQMGVTRKSLEPMSAKFDWVARAEEYDSYILDCVAAQNTAQIVKMHEKHAAIAEQMLRKATSRLLTIPDADIDANAAVRMVDIGVKVERLSRGEPIIS